MYTYAPKECHFSTSLLNMTGHQTKEPIKKVHMLHPLRYLNRKEQFIKLCTNHKYGITKLKKYLLLPSGLCAGSGGHVDVGISTSATSS